MSSNQKSIVFRVNGLSNNEPVAELRARLTDMFHERLTEEERQKIHVLVTIVPSCYNEDGMKVALVNIKGGIPNFLLHLKNNPLDDWQDELDGEDINFDRHFFGFTQLYSTVSDQEITADVIAISGLDGHAYGSWQAKGNLTRMWLCDFFRRDFPRCRTMIYGYNSKLSSRGISVMLDYGREFLEQLQKIRYSKKLQERPLIFIAHSFGGLIVAHTLIKSFQMIEDDNPAAASIYKATYAIFFFGTPHQGLMTDDIGTMLGNSGNHPRQLVLNEINRTSEVLASQLMDFKNRIRDRKIVTYYETEQTRKLVWSDEDQRWVRGGDFATTVEKDSAILNLPDSMEAKIPLHFDHSAMVKFSHRFTLGYTSVREKLRQFELDAPEVIKLKFSPARNSNRDL